MDVYETEIELVELSEQLTAPLPRECLDCFLSRMLAAYGCAGHRFTRRWARSRLRGSEGGLVRWAAQRGGCCCDCEVVMNSLRTAAAARRGGVLCAAAIARRQVDAEEWVDTDGDTPPAGCSGVP